MIVAWLVAHANNHFEIANHRVKNWVLKTEVNGTASEGENARLPAMTAMLIPGLIA